MKIRTRLLAAAVLAAGGFQVLRAVRRELAGHRADSARLQTRWTTIAGIAGAEALRLHARAAGGARSGLAPAVLVHGYGVDSDYLVPLAACLGDHGAVWVPDLPGHGRSDHDTRPLSVAELARALAAWMDARGLRSALLVGHSLGCQIVAEAAARRPELAAGVVLIGPTSDPAARSAARQIARGLGTAAFERPSFYVWGALGYGRAGARVLMEEMRQMVGHRLEDVLPRIAAPVRVVRGARDVIVPQPWAETVARLAGAPAPIVIPRWGHAVQYDDPEAAAQAVLDLARSL